MGITLAYLPLVISIPLLLPLLLLLLLTRRKKNEGKPASKQLPPCPPRLPIIGNFHQLGEFPHRSLFHLSQKHAALMFLQLGTIPTLVASSSVAAKEILKTHDLDSCSRPPLTSWKKLAYNCNDIALSPYGDSWRELRKISIIEFFSSKKVALFQSVREEEVDRMITSLSNNSQSTTVNLSEILLTLSNDITCRAALGKRYSGEGSRLLNKILTESQAMLGGLFFADYFPMLGWLDVLTGMRGRLEKNFRDLDSFYEQVIDEHLDPKGERQGRGEDTMDALLRLQKDGENITRDQIKAVIMVC